MRITLPSRTESSATHSGVRKQARFYERRQQNVGLAQSLDDLRFHR